MMNAELVHRSDNVFCLKNLAQLRSENKMSVKCSILRNWDKNAAVVCRPHQRMWCRSERVAK